VDSISNVIAYHVKKLIDANGLILLSYECTMLSDDILLCQFGGSKGGMFMQFKFGLTIMNCQEPNYATAFDVCAMLDAPDTYSNLKATIFD